MFVQFNIGDSYIVVGYVLYIFQINNKIQQVIIKFIKLYFNSIILKLNIFCQIGAENANNRIKHLIQLNETYFLQWSKITHVCSL